MAQQTETFAKWVGLEQSSDAEITTDTAQKMAAMLGIEPPRQVLPACWSWLYHLEVAPRGQINSDGHAITGAFLPPIPAKRRMFAGSYLTFHAPVRIGAQTRLRQTLCDVQYKPGRQGGMWIVTVGMDLYEGSDLLIKERRNIVYLNTLGGPRQGPTSHMQADFSDTENPDEILLFRFSALTFNSHRIHYDQVYTTRVEQYPERVVHGPLQAILLAGCAERWSGHPLTKYSFRGQAPAFLGDQLTLRGSKAEPGKIDLEICAADGIVTTSARADY